MSEVRLTDDERDQLEAATDGDLWLGYESELVAAVEGIVRARLAAVEALADEWEAHLGGPEARVNDTAWDVLADLRAALNLEVIA